MNAILRFIPGTLDEKFSDTSYDGKYEVSTNYHCDADNILPHGQELSEHSDYSNDITDSKCQEICSSYQGKDSLT